MRTSHVLEGVECSQSFEDKTNLPAFWKAPMDKSRQIQLYLVSLEAVPVCSNVQRFVFNISLCFFVFLDTFIGQPGGTEKPGLNINNLLLCFRIFKRFGFIRFGDTFKLQRSLNLICNQVKRQQQQQKQRSVFATGR